jgi:beta-glucosidase
VSRFPDGFLWGAASAAHQVEGGNVYNDSWLLEHVAGSHYAEPSGDACDHYHRYPDDIELAARLGLGAYRFSLEWSRIEPEEGELSRAALDHYRRMLDACHERGLVPLLSFHHFTSPRWIAQDGGWESPRTAERFARFCERAMRHLGDLVPFACTINEPNLGALLHEVIGVPSPRGGPAWATAAAALQTMPDRLVPLQHAVGPRAVEVARDAHRLAFEAIKGVRDETQVGLTIAMSEWEALPGGEATLERLRGLAEDVFLEDVEGDFFGVQNYTGLVIGPDGPVEPAADVERTLMGYAFRPEALEHTIRRAARVTGLPLIVTENGIATDDDTRRVAFIERALRGVETCIRDGIDVRGYLYWSLLDNFEWVFGYGPTFGLVAVDRATQTRTVRPSARRYGELIRRSREAPASGRDGA